MDKIYKISMIWVYTVQMSRLRTLGLWLNHLKNGSGLGKDLSKKQTHAVTAGVPLQNRPNLYYFSWENLEKVWKAALSFEKKQHRFSFYIM